MFWDTVYAGGLRKSNGDDFYKCDPYDTWYAPIGQMGSWDGNNDRWIPSVTGQSTTSTELWVRIDNVKCPSCKIYSDRIESPEIIEY